MLTRFSTLLAFCAVTFFLTGLLFSDSLPRPIPTPVSGNPASPVEDHNGKPAGYPSELAAPTPEPTETSLFVDLFPPGESAPAFEDLRPQLRPFSKRPPPEPIQIAITDTSGSHDDTVAALVYGFGSAKGAHLHLYQLLQRHGIDKILSAFELYSEPPKAQAHDAFSQEGAVTPDVVVLTTCELDIIQYSSRLEKLLADRKTYLFCVMQQPDRWSAATSLQEAVKPWIEAGMLDFLTLSPRLVDFFKEKTIPEWKTTTIPPVRPFTPIFPFTLPSLPDHEEKPLQIALQGAYDAPNRDYPALFSRLSALTNHTSASPGVPSKAFADWLSKQSDSSTANLTLHLLGHGPHPSVPADLAHNVVFHDDLIYNDTYTTLSHSFAQLQGLNTTLSASASALALASLPAVPASLVAGVPLVASYALVEAYGYLRPEDGGKVEDLMWLRLDGEGEMEVVARALMAGEKDRRGKREKVRELREKLVKRNRVLVNEWVERARDKIKAKGEEAIMLGGGNVTFV